jgi:OmpA-OmpF porin, OOP family
MNKKLLTFAVLIALSAPTLALDFYALGNAGQSKLELESDEDTDVTFSLGFGFKLNNNFAIEAAYADLGEISGNYYEDLGGGDFFEEDFTNEASALQVSLVASLPLGKATSIYGRVGIADIDVDLSYRYRETFDGEIIDDESGSGSVSKSKAVFGLGFAYSFSPAFALRTEYGQYAEWDGFKLSTITAGLTYQF